MATKNSHYVTVSELELDIGLLQKDIEQLQEQIVEIKDDIKTIKGYFVKIMFGGAGIVGMYIIQWLLSGGIAGVVNTAQATMLPH